MVHHLQAVELATESAHPSGRLCESVFSSRQNCRTSESWRALRWRQPLRVELSKWSPGAGWTEPLPTRANFVLTVASHPATDETSWRDDLRARLGDVPHLGCSTAGDISGTTVDDGGVVACFVTLERSTVRLASAPLTDSGSQAGAQIAATLAGQDLKHVFVLADGLRTNGSVLSQALQAGLGSGVTVSGGLAGDHERFERTTVWTHDPPANDTVVALGLYGDALRVGFGTKGGWRPFGPERRVTRSKGNRLYTLESQTALELYRTYLGELADELPAAGLRFPLRMRDGDGRDFVRTVLAIEPEDGSMVFAGDIPEGSYARLMHTGNEGLIGGAETAAEQSNRIDRPELALLVSCVGRRLVLAQETEDELEAVSDVLGPSVPQVGFYSYGELCPRVPDLRCDLHNQTMTITTLSEAV